MAAATVSGIQNMTASTSTPESPEAKKVRTKTTRPIIPPTSERKPIRTGQGRLLMRAPVASDLEAFHLLRTQPEVMQWTMVGTVDKDRDATREWMARFLPPNDDKFFQFVIIYLGEKDDELGNAKDEQGVLIGVGGVMNAGPQGQPEVGYMFRKEFWGKGFATVVVRELTKAWWALPRREVVVDTDAALVPESQDGETAKETGTETVDGGGAGEPIQIPEVLKAVIAAENIGSRRVLEKSGFKQYIVWTEDDSREDYDGIITLVGFKMEAPAS